ncbi:Hypothetical predicted protein, partial [Pelobates cultripes]
MEDFLDRAGALVETTETLSITEEKALSVLWPRSSQDLPHTHTAKDLYNDLSRLK